VSHASSPPNSPVVEKRRATLRSPISRRDFGWCAAIAAAITLSPSTLLGSIRNSNQESKPGDKTPDKGEGLTPEQSQEVEERLANIVHKYGNRLSAEQRQHLRRILTYNERMLVSIRTFPLKNGDPPASVLKLPRLSSQAAPAKPSLAASGESWHLLSGAEEDQA
jgi:hypothetical protein